ncbi:unnamed protein product [Caenorhabditis brenneri]
MSATKPLAYDSLKIIIKYMEPHLRVGIDEDLTEHGFVISSTCHDLTPGDLITTPPGGFVEEKEEILGDSQNKLEYYERYVKISEEALANRHGEKIACNDFQLKNPSSWTPRAGKDPLQNEATDRIIVRTLTQYSDDILKSAIRICKAELVPFYCRRDNTPLPFTPMLQLTVKSPTEQKIYHYSYNMKLREAMKKLNTALFSGYRNIIQMKFIQQWIEARKEVGTMISYTVREVVTVDELMHEIERRQLGVIREKHLAYISIDSGRRLQITCKKGNYGSHLGLTLKGAVALKVVAKRQFL